MIAAVLDRIGTGGRDPAGSVLFALTLAMLALCAFATNSVPAIAWWNLKKGTRSAKGWAILACLLNLPIPVLQRDGLTCWSLLSGPVSIPLALMGAAFGLFGLIVFSRPNAVLEAAGTGQRATGRIPGDGTGSLSGYAACALGAVWLWFCVRWWFGWGAARQLPTPGFLALLVQFQLASLLANFSHEAGHVLAGWASDMKLYSFQIGPLRWAIRNGGWTFRFLSDRFAGGAVSMVPTHLVNIRGRRAFGVLGGPAASLLVGALAGLAALSARGQLWEPFWVLPAMISTIASVSLILNSIPQKPDKEYSDGAQFYQLVRKGPWAHVDLALAMAECSLATSIRPKDWDIGVLRRAGELLPQGEQGMSLQLYACMHYLETGQIEEALLRLKAAENLLVESKLDATANRCSIFAFLNAVFKRDGAAAELWWQRVESRSDIEFDADYWKARSAVLWLRGRPEDAQQAWEHGYDMALKLPAHGAYEHTRWCFHRLNDAMETREAERIAQRAPSVT